MRAWQYILLWCVHFALFFGLIIVLYRVVPAGWYYDFLSAIGVDGVDSIEDYTFDVFVALSLIITLCAGFMVWRYTTARARKKKAALRK
ncbi:MAG TPA: hypothetical protein VJY99_12640 [Buttiauxella sp.]|uniref:hypothetical protein n=1 Tax=Buttiauxella sp. TaxID=1972222 RepID=UPI002B48C5CD|nr:hypothetical protein [Buttiauxella sp.]HKM97523.1 hypothetical protein [Buttiauxella sp.]